MGRPAPGFAVSLVEPVVRARGGEPFVRHQCHIWTLKRKSIYESEI